jgi:hypothetical protein
MDACECILLLDWSSCMAWTWVDSRSFSSCLMRSSSSCGPSSAAESLIFRSSVSVIKCRCGDGGCVECAQVQRLWTISQLDPTPSTRSSKGDSNPFKYPNNFHMHLADILRNASPNLGVRWLLVTQTGKWEL